MFLAENRDALEAEHIIAATAILQEELEQVQSSHINEVVSFFTGENIPYEQVRETVDTALHHPGFERYGQKGGTHYKAGDEAVAAAADTVAYMTTVLDPETTPIMREHGIDTVTIDYPPLPTGNERVQRLEDVTHFAVQHLQEHYPAAAREPYITDVVEDAAPGNQASNEIAEALEHLVEENSITQMPNRLYRVNEEKPWADATIQSRIHGAVDAVRSEEIHDRRREKDLSDDVETAFDYNDALHFLVAVHDFTYEQAIDTVESYHDLFNEHDFIPEKELWAFGEHPALEKYAPSEIRGQLRIGEEELGILTARTIQEDDSWRYFYWTWNMEHIRHRLANTATEGGEEDGTVYHDLPAEAWKR